ncbi:hypothetical protein CHS0354_042432 [Potamilus streckersoni]|uniref:Ubiquitin carboxyl-terminal hydrolase n=1 Tax=Potamilus streckersoni TaxID=2493646 RepID=A0AAE0STZ3_9BIVA|nr:hypothetical protein CHS0354_042432 [Potamilus streckersoni]
MITSFIFTREQEQLEKERQERLLEEQRILEREKQLLIEKEKQAALEEQKRLAAQKAIEEKERLEQERLEKERLDKERVQREKEEKEKSEKAQVEKAQLQAEEKLRLLKEERQTSKTIPSPNLPPGWEKRLDPNTRRYFYINHNSGTTQWEPPFVTPGQVQVSSNTFTTKLKDEPSGLSRYGGGLKRSSSSPNIAKLVEEEVREKKVPLPSVDRSKKPEMRQEPVHIVTPVLRRDLNPVYGNVGRALTGLRNLGNTCYMNSTIQCLNNTSPLITYFLTDDYLHDFNRDVGNQVEVVLDFAVVIKALWSGQYRCITPRDFKIIVGKYQPMFAGYEQQDSQEFLTFLLDGLHEGLNKVKKRPNIPELNTENLADNAAAELSWKNHKLMNESIIVELFQGQLKSTLMCLTCKKKSITFQAFMYLSLPIPTNSRCSLQDCLRKFLQEEKMSGSSRWRCPQCKVERDSIKKIDIWKLPRILLIGLNRFVYDGPWRQKISTYVDFPVQGLDLATFTNGPPGRKQYKLYGISNHYGTMDGGHYTAFCRNPCTQKWYKFDDHEVFDMSESEVKTSAAFVLYYTSIELTPPDFRQPF